MTIDWPSVLPVWATQVVLTATIITAVALINRRTIRRTIAEQMTAAVKAMSRRLDASEIYLTAAEQHTAHQEDWEKRRAAEHERRQKEYADTLQKIVRDEIHKQLKLSEMAVVNEVKQNPDATADKVVEKLQKQPGTGDSHHG